MSKFDNSDNNRNDRPTKSSSGISGKMSSSKTEFHPAVAVSNIKNHIPVVLEMEKDQYGNWVEFFRIHACSHRVLHHIVPSKDKTTPADTSSAEYE